MSSPKRSRRSSAAADAADDNDNDNGIDSTTTTTTPKSTLKRSSTIKPKKVSPTSATSSKKSTPPPPSTASASHSAPAKSSRPRSVAFGEVSVQGFERIQARDKVPDDGHAAALGLGDRVGQAITRRMSAFEAERRASGRSPAKVYGVERKLSFNTRQSLLLATAADSGTALRKRKSIIEYDKEVEKITESRNRSSGCECAAADCRTSKCICWKEQLECLWDLCACACSGAAKCSKKHRHCVNEFNADADDNN